MARLARIVVPRIPHHVTQRGNRRLDVFFGDDDYRAYLDLPRTAWLQDKLKQIAGAQGLTISSLQSMGADTGHGFRTVAMRAAMSGQIGQLQPMLHALETHAPILVIRNLDLRSTGSRSPRSLDQEDARLSIRMDVMAYLKAPSP